MTSSEHTGLSRDDLLSALERALQTQHESEHALQELRVHQIELEMQNRTLRAAREELEASRNRYAELYDFAPVAYATFDEAGCVLDINLTGATMIGIDRALIMGRPLNSLVRFEQPASFWNHLRECKQTRRPAAADLRFLNKHGASFDVRASTSPAVDGGGRLTLRTAFSDITQTKRIEDDQRLLAAIGEALTSTLDHDNTPANIARFAAARFADVCIVEVLDDDGRMVHRTIAHRDPNASAAADAPPQPQPDDTAQQPGGQPDDAARSHIGAFVLGSSVPALATDVTRAYLRSIAGSVEHERTLLDIAPRSLIAVPLWARGRQVGVILLLRTQASPQFTNRDLSVATELGRRAALAIDNARLYRAAQAAVRARENVLTVVAHDLRGPLTVILLESARVKNDACAEAIEAAARRMRSIVDELLEAARIDGGRVLLRREPVGVRQLIDAVIAGHLPLAHQLKIDLAARIDLTDLTADADVFVHVDLDHALRIFENLVGNALKFTPPDGRIVVSATQRGDKVSFAVSDTGPGISAEDLPHIFDRFWQGKGVRTGGGVGLAIVKGLVEAHGGAITVTSVTSGSAPSGAGTGTGTTFSFALPLVTRPDRLDRADG